MFRSDPTRLSADPLDASPDGSRDGWERGAAALTARPIAPVVVVALLAAIALARVPLCGDVAWQFWIAHHIRMGARLYVDIVEVNPPLWFWMAVPIDALADLLGVEPSHLLVSTLAVATIASLAATDRLLPYISRTRRTALLVYAALAILVLPAWMTGQREQILLITSLPYLALVAARRDGRSVSPGFAIGIGIAAALGFALKHYFLITPVLLEIWLIVALRRAWRPIRPETLAILAVGAAYAVATLSFAPAFLTRIVPLVRLSYGALGTRDLAYLFQLPQCIWIGSLVVFAIHRRSIGRATPFTVALLVASLGFGLAWAIQHKGWAYQAIAASGTIAIALAALMAETGRGLNMLAPAMLLCPVIWGAHGDGSIEGYRPVLAPLAAETRPGETIGMISLDTGLIWPFTSEQKLRYPSRYYGYWMLYSVLDPSNRDPRMAALGQQVVDETVRDYRCTPPDKIVFSHDPRVTSMDIYDFFLRDPAFRNLMTHYRRERWDYGVEVYKQVSQLPPIDASACRRGI